MTNFSVQDKVKISLSVNGKEMGGEAEPRKLLSDFIREDLGLTGTHVGCEHGVCGSCTVLYNGKAVRSCLMFAVQANGSDIQTIEGLAKDGEQHRLQQAFTECHGLQCGFCTPGILMSSVELLNNNEEPNLQEIKEMLSGHLCRCTGYTGIINAIQKACCSNECKEGEN
ncbi:(2Fe-2S)-binding protein [Bacillus sp. DTU_2020_1000418_1_SI_GHA_SEK_038]|uniref:(2Fe-2S)-binding protein n=1 Tax=Bacillus sp. DTU_2020_1000418_1_SI_GHA_SEK_038 TaxID=3077585 RepID=UPI0028F017C2|nr:2Fe-2S iron-sulfur cluster-binding protein [Bacillus sp. DTU_2020_1000418_1_SI_GHA_SEK_038]WNS73646.1 (2Fe-2S)-binding protein [Bacillus sp. DTU_2020_1000418_1_SI_GHA_SEK_038]